MTHVQASDLVVDGNAIGGLLLELFGRDMTAVARVCDACGARHPLGRHRAYRGAGVVLRCPSCDVVALVVVPGGRGAAITLTGVLTLSRSR